MLFREREEGGRKGGREGGREREILITQAVDVSYINKPIQK